MGACVCFSINLCRISDSFDGVLERLALQFSLLFSVTQLYGRKSQPPVNFLNSALMFGPTMSREKDMRSLQMLFSRMAYCKVSQSVGCKDDNKVSVQLAALIRKSEEFFYRQHEELG